MTNIYYVIYAVLAVFVIAMLSTAYVVKQSEDAKEFETQKIRFAAVLFIGFLVLVLFTAILAIVDDSESNRGMEVFKTVMTGLSPIAGGIIGYLFSSKEK